MTTCSFLCRVAGRKGMQSCYFFGMFSWMWQYHNLLGVENQLHEKYGRVSRSERYFYQIINREKFQPEISKWLIISSSSCMTGTVSTKVLANAASIYLHRWIAQCTTAYLHEMLCCNTFARESHSQTYGRIAWHWTKLIKICHIQAVLWMTKARSSQYG